MTRHHKTTTSHTAIAAATGGPAPSAATDAGNDAAGAVQEGEEGEEGQDVAGATPEAQTPAPVSDSAPMEAISLLADLEAGQFVVFYRSENNLIEHAEHADIDDLINTWKQVRAQWSLLASHAAGLNVAGMPRHEV